MRIERPAIFAGMGEAFAGTFGNVDCLFTVDGIALPDPVRGILRQKRELELADAFGRQDVEAVTHVLSVPATGLEDLESERDTVTIGGTVYDICNVTDDGRAMLKVWLRGDI
ncbi:head-tail joining protein [Martelella mangrovi]|uniref:Phage head-tail adapter protein n=1 Tax=Martelella mangrovi TaxID=1397477 RepID=A0ABV2IGV4_9HYPH